MEAVNHPAHYNIPGRKECIDEMLDLYGLDAVLNFCVLNSYKYLYRHELKNGQEDLDKAKWYQDKGLELAKNSGKIRIAEHYGLEPQMQQLIEEMAELTQAICKHKRKNGDGQPLSDAIAARHVEENLIEELAPPVSTVWQERRFPNTAYSFVKNRNVREYTVYSKVSSENITNRPTE